MAVTTCRSSQPVRGYYVTTINLGRTIVTSGHGFGVPRLGGLINAYVDGLTNGGTGAVRMATAAPEETPRVRELNAALVREGEKVSEADRLAFIERRKAAYKAEAEAVKKGEEVRKTLGEQAHKPVEDPKGKVEIVKDAVTGEKKLAGGDHVPAEALNDPKVVAKAAEQGKPTAATTGAPAPEKK